MADKTILELTPITPQSGDVLPIARPGTTTSNSVEMDALKQFITGIVEQVAAQAIAENASKIEAIEQQLSQGIFTKITTEELVVVRKIVTP